MNNCVDCCHHKRQPGAAYWSTAETQSPSWCFGFWEFLSSSYLLTVLSSSSPLTFVIFMYPYPYPPPPPPTSFHIPILLFLRFLISSLFYSPFIFFLTSFNLLFSFYSVSSSSSFCLCPSTFIFFCYPFFNLYLSSTIFFFPSYFPLSSSSNVLPIFLFYFPLLLLPILIHFPLFLLLVHLLPLVVSLCRTTFCPSSFSFVPPFTSY